MLRLLDDISQAESVADYEAAIRACMGSLGVPYFDASYIVDAPRRLPFVVAGAPPRSRATSSGRRSVDGVLNFESSSAFVATHRDGATSAWHTVGAIPAAMADGCADIDAIRRDPVVAHTRDSNTPLLWDADTYGAAGAGDLWEQQAEHGLRHGIAVAMHLPDGRHFRIGVESADPLARSEDALANLLGRVQLVLVHAHDAAARLYEVPVDEMVCPLTPAQLSCLRWAAAGKTAWETGRIVGISESTVSKHLHAACRRLNCSSKVRAAALALQFGWI